MHKMWDKNLQFLQSESMFLIFEVFLPLYVPISELEVVKSHHGISLNALDRDTWPANHC